MEASRFYSAELVATDSTAATKATRASRHPGLFVDHSVTVKFNFIDKLPVNWRYFTGNLPVKLNFKITANLPVIYR